MRIVFERRGAEQQHVTSERRNRRDRAPSCIARMSWGPPKSLRLVDDEQIYAGACRKLGEPRPLDHRLQRDDHTALLSKISVPALIILGSDDAITPVADSEKMHEEIGGSRLVVLENAGHVSNLERTEQFNQALLGFLKELSN